MNHPTNLNSAVNRKRIAAIGHEIAGRDPLEFRKLLRLDAEFESRWCDQVQSWQHRDLLSLDPAWRQLAGLAPTWPDSKVPRRPCYRAYIERPRGHSKTTDMAVQIAWILQYSSRRVAGLAAASDQDQAGLILQSLRRLVDHNRWLHRDLTFTQHDARNSKTGSRLSIISSDVGSSYGALVDFIVCDELCHWREAGLWNSLLSTAAKKPRCLLTILTNAGIGRGWQWDVREHARTSSDWYFSTMQGPQAPWITNAWLHEQQALLPGPVFRRLWWNEWQHSDGEFVTLAEVEACRDETLSYQSHGRSRVTYVAAIDYAEKHDLTVGCVCHREGATIIVDRMDVVQPSPMRPTPVAWVENWMVEVGQNFPGVRFVVDEYQLLSVIQHYLGRYAIERFKFHGGEGNHKLATTLRHLIVERKVKWYADCGAVDAQSPFAPRKSVGDLPAVNTLETELASLLLKQSTSGRVRIDHIHDGTHHDDRSFVLGVCCLELAQQEDVFLTVTQPDERGGFAL